MDIEAAKIRESAARATRISATLISLLMCFFFKRSKVENQSSFMQKWGRIDLRFTKKTASVTRAKKWRMMSNRVTALSTSQTLDLGCFGNCLPIIFRPLASKNIVTLFLVENSEKSKQMKHAVKRTEESKTVKQMKRTEGTQWCFATPSLKNNHIGLLLRGCPCYRIKLFKLMETLARNSVVFCVLCV